MSHWFSTRFAGVMVALALLAVLTVGTASPALAADPRDFTLVNASSSTIRELYVSPSNSSDWEEDVLGDDMLSPGQRVNITFSRFRPGHCCYDIKVVTRSGSESELHDVDLCNTRTVTYR
jgi:hypothetical protein